MRARRFRHRRQTIPVVEARTPLLVALLGATLFLGGAVRVPSQVSAANNCEALLTRDDGGLRAGHCLLTAGLGTQGEAALEVLRQLTEAHPEQLWLRLYLGALVRDRGQTGAETHFEIAAQAFTAAGEHRGAAHSHINLSRLKRSRGDHEGALAELYRAEHAAGLTGNEELIAEVKVQEARLLIGHAGDLGRAQRLLAEAAENAAGTYSHSLRRDLLLALGEVEFSLGRYHRARQHYAALAEAAIAAGDLTAEATALLDLALVRISERQIPADRSQARADLQRAIAKAVEAADYSSEAAARQNLGRLQGADGADQLLRAHDIALQLGDPLLLANGLGALASLELSTDPARAADRIDEVLELAADSGQPRIETYIWSDRLRVRWATLPREEALADGLRLLDLLEETSDRQDANLSRADYLGAWTDAYRWLAGRLLDGEPSVGDVEMAFRLVERMRARVLRQALARQQLSTSRREEQLLRRQVAINRRLLGPLREAERNSSLAELEEVERHLAGARTTAVPADEVPPFFAELGAIEDALLPGEAMLSFQLGLWENIFGHQAGGAWLVVTSVAGRQVHRLADRARLAPLIGLFRGLFESREQNQDSERRAAAKLFGELLAAALAELPPEVDRLVIVPDGILHLLPFDALRAAPDSPPLVETYAISVVPSASLWHQWRQRSSRPATAGALILADPELDNVGAATAAAASERSALFAAGSNLGPLPWARREGRAVHRRLGGQLLSGTEASESQLKQLTADHTVLHLAAHAVVDSERSWRSAVLLAPGGEDQDGLLQPHEIHRLPLDDQLVVLSACQTGAGTVLQGEGPMSLARAFFQAGAKTVVASLWPLRDDEAARLMESFATHLSKGDDVATALARAKRDQLANGAPSAAWAGVVALGDGATTPFPGGRRSVPWPWMAVSLAGLLVLSWWLNQRRG